MAKQAIAFDDLSVQRQTISGISKYRLKAWPSDKPDPDKPVYGNPAAQRFARWKRIQTLLMDHDQHVASIQADRNLSGQGKFESVTKLKAGVAESLKELNRSLDPSMAEIDMLDKRISAELDQRLARNAAKHESTLRWMATVSAEMRSEAWKLAKIHGDTDLYETALSMNPIIRRLMLPTLKSDDDVAELRAKVAEVAAPALVEERQQLHAETAALAESILAAEKYLQKDVIIGGGMTPKTAE